MNHFKIDFLVIGSQKCGTSSLDNYMRLHPDIELGYKKELHFFDNEEIFQEPIVDYNLLHSSFADKAKLKGDVTPIYLYWEPCIKRIWAYNKEIKLIALLRNPIDRAYSHWNMETNRKLEKRSFYSAITQERDTMREALPLQHRVFSYLDRGFYSEQIRRVMRFFPDDQLLFIKYDEYLKNQNTALGEIFNFLAVDPSKFEYEHKMVHKRLYKESMSVDTRKYLVDVYRNDICEVERLLGWDCSDWMSMGS